MCGACFLWTAQNLLSGRTEDNRTSIMSQPHTCSGSRRVLDLILAVWPQVPLLANLQCTSLSTDFIADLLATFTTILPCQICITRCGYFITPGVASTKKSWFIRPFFSFVPLSKYSYALWHWHMLSYEPVEASTYLCEIYPERIQRPDRTLPVCDYSSKKTLTF